MKLKPFVTIGINHEPINWKLVSNIQTDSADKYEYCAPSQYTDRKYHLCATINQEGEFQHITMR